MNYPQRMYSKTELGLLYFPDTTDGATARRHIMGWIKRCEPLWNELQRLGYQEHSQYFPPRQVFTIFELPGRAGGIKKKGCVISPYDTPSLPFTFPFGR